MIGVPGPRGAAARMALPAPAAVLAIWLVVGAAGCRSGRLAEAPPKPMPNTAPTAAQAASDAMNPLNPNPTLQQLVDAAIADAAARSGAAPGAIRVLDADAVTWSVGSLGCPQPGMLYTQALVPGYRIRLDVGGKAYDYHAGTRGAPVLCPKERVVEPTRDGGKR